MLNFAVGPVMMDKEILKIGATQLPYFRTNDFSNVILENESILKELSGAKKSSRVIFLTGSGTAAMESSIINLFNKKDKVLVVNGGNFGKRFKELCDIHNINSKEIKLNYGETLNKNHLSPYDGKGFTGFLINMHETTTGVLYDMRTIKDFCSKNKLFLVVDAISSFLADHYNMQDYGVNATILGSQKALALPPGMSFVILDEVAQKRINKKHNHTLYFDFNRYLRDGKRGQTPYTPAVTILLQLRKRLSSIKKIGINNIINNTARIANDFRAKIVNIPLEIPWQSLSNTLTPLKPTGNMTADEIVSYLKDHNIFVCPNGGDLKEKIFRVGHIGSITKKDNNTLISLFIDMKNKGIL